MIAAFVAAAFVAAVVGPLWTSSTLEWIHGGYHRLVHAAKTRDL